MSVILPTSVACWAKVCSLPQQKYFHGKPFPLSLCPVSHRCEETDSNANSSFSTGKDMAVAPAETADGSTFAPSISISTCSGIDSKTVNESECLNISRVCESISSSVSDLSALQLEYGALYFRGFPLQSAKDFDEFVSAFHLEHLPYLGGAAVRNRVVGNVYTTNESPADQLIPFHHEMAQVPTHPSRLFFFCDTPPLRGGETPILLSHEVYTRACREFPQFISELDQKGVRYVRVLPEVDDPSSPIGRGWKSTFLCERKEDAQAKCLAQGSTFEWITDPSLPNKGGTNCGGASEDIATLMKTISAVLPGIRVDERTGKKVFFNSIIAAHRGWKDRRNDNEKAVVFGDGSPMDINALRGIAGIMDQIAVAIPWQKGDVAFIDNKTVMHSRNHFEGDRVIYAALMKT